MVKTYVIPEDRIHLFGILREETPGFTIEETEDETLLHYDSGSSYYMVRLAVSAVLAIAFTLKTSEEGE